MAILSLCISSQGMLHIMMILIMVMTDSYGVFTPSHSRCYVLCYHSLCSKDSTLLLDFLSFSFLFPREGSGLKALVYTKYHIDSTDSKRLDCFTLESVILIIVSYCFQVPMVKGTYTVQ